MRKTADKGRMTGISVAFIPISSHVDESNDDQTETIRNHGSKSQYKNGKQCALGQRMSEKYPNMALIYGSKTSFLAIDVFTEPRYMHENHAHRISGMASWGSSRVRYVIGLSFKERWTKRKTPEKEGLLLLRVTCEHDPARLSINDWKAIAIASNAPQ